MEAKGRVNNEQLNRKGFEDVAAVKLMRNKATGKTIIVSAAIQKLTDQEVLRLHATLQRTIGRMIKGQR